MRDGALGEHVFGTGHEHDRRRPHGVPRQLRDRRLRPCRCGPCACCHSCLRSASSLRSGADTLGGALGPQREPAVDDSEQGCSRAVGPHRRRARAIEEIEQSIGRMPVPVVGADADDAHRRTQLRVEVIALVGRAVVGDLHDVDRADRRRPRAGAVATPRRGRRGRCRDTRVSRGRARRSRRCRARRPALGQSTRQRASPSTPAVTHRHLDRVGTCRDEGIEGPARALVVERTMHDDVHAADDGGCAADVIGVPVGEHEQVDAVDRQEVDAATERCRIAARCR